MAVRKTIQIGDSRLHKRAKKIKNIHSKRLKQLITDMRDTMRSLGLVGLAAPQIGVMERVFITEVRKTPYRKTGLDTLRIYINPKITKSSKKEVKMYEGCGSVLEGGIFGEVKRPEKIHILFTDENGNLQEQVFAGLLGRVVQHEYDHLNGILFTERLTDPKTLVDREHYMKLMGRK